MARQSPIGKRHEAANAAIAPYGPPSEARQDGPQEHAISLVQAFRPVEFEYAAIRKFAGLIDQPQRATVVVTGDERVSFLHRMLTQKIEGVPTNTAVRSFWLNRKGRIDADMRVLLLPDRIVLDVDVHAAPRLLETLDAYLITEDVTLDDQTEAFHRFALHGPAALRVFSAHATRSTGEPIGDIAPGGAVEVLIGKVPIVVDRQDALGDIGLELLVPAESAEAIYDALAAAFEEPPEPPETPEAPENTLPGAPEAPVPLSPTDDLPRATPVGWHAWNIARIEAGWPQYLLDFGPNSLPNETGVLEDRVHFSKGCYLGQEIVARLRSRGGPKQQLVALKCDVAHPAGTHAEDAHTRPLQPMTGDPIFAADTDPTDANAKPIGAVTSSALSPMLGDTPICFAMLKSTNAGAEANVVVMAESQPLAAQVQPTLQSWQPANATS